MAIPVSLGTTGSTTPGQTSVAFSGYSSPSGGTLRIFYHAIMSAATTPNVPSGGGGTWTLVKEQPALSVWYGAIWEMSGTPDGTDITISRSASETWSVTWGRLIETVGYGTVDTQAAVSDSINAAAQNLAYGSTASAGTMLLGTTCNFNAGTGITFAPDPPWTVLVGALARTGNGNQYVHYVENDNSVTEYGGDWSSSNRWIALAVEINSTAPVGPYVVVTAANDIQG